MTPFTALSTQPTDFSIFLVVFSVSVPSFFVSVATLLIALPALSYWRDQPDTPPVLVPLPPPMPFSALSVSSACLRISFSGPLALSRRTNAASTLTAID